MSFADHVRSAVQGFQQRWDRMADRAFGKPPAAHDEMARGEFISAFISESGLNFPATGKNQPRD
ncbi:hypothetical protein [Aestuariivirga sp.]|uniref:hypothetical protein n=1 Tax=Aestuariivirga sp. TaxID=2650926 RepID=UPI0025C29E98|nr:hypothetical protein [Aestuariivirga sp.]MCA3555231.1 hypothetical protein [Aestuariivirga sp.]